MSWVAERSARARSLGTAVALGALCVVAACGPPVFTAAYLPMTVRAAPPPPPPPPPPEQIKIPEQIQFERNAARILPASFRILDGVVDVLKGRPGVTMVEIQGHTDATGDPAKNKTLSLERANSVRAYLIRKGIAPERLTTAGFGAEKPLATNDTPEGRQQNRRVEFHILQQAK
jgi:outer membrane protein OmpA-like peptidoglycan-associated protein